jgi:hypothetical protein
MSAPQDRKTLQTLFKMASKSQLRKVAKENGLTGYSTLNKEQLVKLLDAEARPERQALRDTAKQARIDKEQALRTVATKLQTKYPNAKVFYKRNVLNFTTIGPPIGRAGNINRKTYNDATDVEANLAQTYGQFIKAVMNDGEDILTGKAVAFDNKKKLEMAFKAFKAMRAKAMERKQEEQRLKLEKATEVVRKAVRRRAENLEKSKPKSKYSIDLGDDEVVPLVEKEFEGTVWLVDEETGSVYGATHLKKPLGDGKSKPFAKLSRRQDFKRWIVTPPDMRLYKQSTIPDYVRERYEEDDE